MKTILVAIVLLFAAGSTVTTQSVEIDESSYDWPSYANDLGSSKYANLDQINAETVGKLTTAWVWNSPDNAQVEANRAFTPFGFSMVVAGASGLATSLTSVIITA